jgi:hypothetical protein
MSFYGFLGFVCGIAAGIVAIAVRSKTSLRRGGPVEADEMTRSVYQKAAAFSFYCTAAVSLIGWTTDNILLYSRGEAVQVFSPWGIMVLTMTYLMLISNLVLYWRHTGVLIDTDCPAQRLFGLAGTSMCASAYVLGRLDSNMRDLALALAPVCVLGLILGVSLLVAGLRKSRRAPNGN